MRVLVHKSEARGKAIAPPSKSYSIRGLMCAALSRGESRILHPLASEDTLAAVNVLRKIGVIILQEQDSWTIKGGELQAPAEELYCGESAATLRFMTAVCALLPGESRLVAGTSLARRPQTPLLQALGQLGIECSWQERLPGVIVKGDTLKSSKITLQGNVSSQFISALLLIAPLLKKGLKLRSKFTPRSKSYIGMTLECLQMFGINIHATGDFMEFNIKPQSYKCTDMAVEGDWSSAAYLLALGAATGKVEVINLNLSSMQGDRMILKFLQQMGVLLRAGQESVTVERSKLRALQADLSDCIDLLPTMAILAALAGGKSEFSGIQNARLKESNRVAAMKQGLERMGVAVTERKDQLWVHGATPRGAVIDTWNDHRIAMAFGVLGACCGKTIINNAECVAKTYPQFWNYLENLGVRMESNVK